MPMRVLDEKILENFQLECLQDLKMDVAGDFREDKNLQGRLLAIFYAYYRYFQADYTRVDELRAGLKFCGSKTGFLAYGAFRTRDEEAISSDAPLALKSWSRWPAIRSKRRLPSERRLRRNMPRARSC